MQAHRRRRFGQRHQAAAGVDVVAAEIADRVAGAVAVLLVQHAPGLQALQQALLVFLADALVQCALVGGLGEQLGYMAIDIGLHMAKALGFAGQGLAVVQIGVVVDLVEGFELDAEALVVVQHRMVVVGHAPGAGVEIVALGKATVWRVPSSSLNSSPPRSVQQRPPARLWYSSNCTL